ncbi:hypothetical protein B0I37DRAFT_230745 [Chaetomium sp. MPI-CAGE-AT-0009]|nr:hypothetical protein B0I37DRAFT_230745 [Chaetomium sp. MPI-CAGE-AT-0009]
MRHRPASNDPAAIPPALISSASQLNINFVHPGYDGDFTSATFLSLPRLDDAGVCFDTALVPCGLFSSTCLPGATVARRLCVRDPETQITNLRMVSPADCRRILRTARSRSPRKQSASPLRDGDNGGYVTEAEQGRDVAGGDYGAFGGTEHFDEGEAFNSPPGLLAQFGPDPTLRTAKKEEGGRGRGRKRAFDVEDDEVNGPQLSSLRGRRL